ncbi:class I SAM-dependent methyltransferase [Microbacterium sp. H1-D42]|uniref:SAM-dependent methyltransferase n=1 Tax=Microbacterium sp. H1-D42 TaxID=2925844 RepID=UPI001F53ACCD|nr:class I SAM-dependent methyltransferase [Microbacterium sp. H1-D42]UNK72142.1 methyltransferase domain-containing protein [Microbacterium sp. H1-D42]
MTTVEQTTPVDQDRLMQFVFRAVGEIGATMNTALVVMGDRLGWYRALAQYGPATAAELAARSGSELHLTREWLNAQAAGEYVLYDPESTRYTLPPEQAVALTDEASPVFLPGLFQIAFGTLRGAPTVIEAASDDGAYGWDERNTDVHEGCERFFLPSYSAHLVTDWLPALSGVVARLHAGARVIDVGCGYGAATILMARAFPASRFVGTDFHAESVDAARDRARIAGVSDRVEFRVANADEGADGPYNLITTFDALHDMGDPAAAARAARRAVADDGTWLIVEPAAGDHVEDNLNPVGRAYYGFSTLLCTPSSLAQRGRAALGTQAGPTRIREITEAAGFSGFRIAAQTPFHNVFEVTV